MGQRLDILGLGKSFSGKVVLDSFDLSVAAGEFVSLLGPSGCGKTTTLNLIAGFFPPDSGAISLGGRDITDQPTHLRGVSMVFQSYALFPHMTVAQNIGFGLRMQGANAAGIARRVDEMLDLVQLPGLGGRFVRQLSGGQQQRVGLARALAIHPPLLVLDEPMSNLDAKLRREMQLELREILDQVGTTTLYVTHDQEEALAMSDRVVVMNEGRVEQVGSPSDVYHNPRTRFVAGFVGESNHLEGEVQTLDAGQALVRTRLGASVSVRSGGTSAAVGETVLLMVRPERVHVRRRNGGLLHGTVVGSAFVGSSVRLKIAVDGAGSFACEVGSAEATVFRIGSAVDLVIDDNAWIVLPRASPRRAS